MDDAPSGSPPDSVSSDASGVESPLAAPDHEPFPAVRKVSEESGWSVERLADFLQTELLEDGSTLESRLEGGSLEAQVQRQETAYADGRLGFKLQRESIRFPMTPAKASVLRDGIASGEINGIVIEAYPTEVEVVLAAPGLDNPSAERLLDSPAVQFLAEHFLERGGSISYAGEQIPDWAAMRYSSSSESLGLIFQAASNELGVAPSEWLEPAGYYRPDTPRFAYTPAFERVVQRVREMLGPPPTLRSRLGSARLVFTNVKQSILPPRNAEKWDRTEPLPPPRLLRDDTPPPEPFHRIWHPNGPTFVELLRKQTDFLTPGEALSLVAAISEPGNVDSYPSASFSSWEWCAAVSADPHDDIIYGARLTGDGGGLDLTKLTVSEMPIAGCARIAVR